MDRIKLLYIRNKSILCLVVMLSVLLSGCQNSINYQLKKIEIPYKKVISPVCCGDFVYMSVSEENRAEGDTNLLLEYNIKNKESTVLYETEHEYANIQGIQVNENWIVWEDMHLYGTQDNIWIMNRKNGEKTKINSIQTEEPSFTIPVLIDDSVFWIEEEDVDDGKISGCIKKYSCITKQKTEIAKLDSIGLNNIYLERFGKILFWSDLVDNESCYFIYDIYHESTKILKMNNEYSLNPILIKDYIVAIEYSSLKDDYLSYIYNISTNKMVELDMDLRGYYAYEDMLLTNDGRNVLLYDISDELEISLKCIVENNKYDDYYVYDNSSLVFISNNYDANKVTLYLFEVGTD